MFVITNAHTNYEIKHAILNMSFLIDNILNFSMKKQLFIVIFIFVGFIFSFYLYLSQNYMDLTEIIQKFNSKNRVCDLTILPEFVIEEDIWISVDEEMSILLFSAYYVGQRKRIYVIGAKIHDEIDAICQLSYVSRNITKETKVEINIEPDGIENKYTSTIFECHVDSAEIPEYVSIVTTPCQTSRYLLIVKDVSPADEYQYKFTVCLSPLFNDVNPYRLVEWIELNRLLGAERFEIYNFSTGQAVEQVLNYYSNKGIVEVVKWRPEVSGDGNASQEIQIHYHAQTASLSDCLYRNKRLSEFVVNLDFDEFIIPHAKDVKNWNDMIALIDESSKGFMNGVISLISHPVSTFVFRSTFFTTKLKHMQFFYNSSKDTSVDRLNLVTLEVVERERRIFHISERTKYITRTSDVDYMYIHKPGTKFASVRPEVGLLHHYRIEIPDNEIGKSGGLIKDLTVKEKFGQELMKRVENISEEILRIQGGQSLL